VSAAHALDEVLGDGPEGLVVDAERGDVDAVVQLRQVLQDGVGRGVGADQGATDQRRRPA
jgi:hypothetical protein